MRLLDRFRGGSDEDDEWPKEREETRTKDVATGFTEYKVTIEYADGSTQTEYATHYATFKDRIELYDCEPRMGTGFRTSTNSAPTRHYPKINTHKGEPLIISLANVNNVDIEEWHKLAFVCENVEYTQVLRQHEEGGEWEEAYEDFTPKDEEYDIREWDRLEWQTYKEDRQS